MKPHKIYFAPMEGITDSYFRSIHAHLFPDAADRYYTPFLSPTYDSPLVEKDRFALLPENNPYQGELIPQILTNQANLMILLSGQLYEMGYKTVNLNLGCPSGTVVSKKKGSGFLGDPDALDRFFDTVFSDPLFGNGTIKLSVKTRLGLFSPDEFDELLAIYNRYPLEELIVHLRVRCEQYRGTPHLELLPQIAENCRHPLCYNGDVFTAGDWDGIAALLPKDKPVRLMLGRGAVSNPMLFDRIRNGTPLDKSCLKAFTEALMEDACSRLSGERHILFRMKELWAYWIVLFENAASLAKRLRKTVSLAEFRSVTRTLFETCSLLPDAGFSGGGDLKKINE